MELLNKSAMARGIPAESVRSENPSKFCLPIGSNSSPLCLGRGSHMPVPLFGSMTQGLSFVENLNERAGGDRTG